jgi:uncharacterized sporulation protein YeaH/YhbH (DUF444 family)
MDDILSNDQKVFIPIDNLSEPHFVYDDELGRRYRFYTGNDQFMPGDKIPRQPGKGRGEGTNKNASDDPNKDQDKFGIVLNKEEFLQYFYKDLELPLMEDRKTTASIDQYRWAHAGTANYGPPPRLNVIGSLTKSLGRRIALKSVFTRKIEKFEALLDEELDIEENERDEKLIVTLEEEIRRAERKRRTIPFLEEVDLRFNLFKKEPIPVNNAVMFALMDVSGSMTKEEKDIAKRFYFFLYLMLTINYDNVHIVWIRHTTEAQRVSEEDFFNSRESGGTIVSSCLELANNIRAYGDEQSPGGYPTSAWNIYCAQASDGGNMPYDMDKCVNILVNDLMRHVNHFSYVQIMTPAEGNLWKHYLEVQKRYPKRFQMKHINNKSEIWSVFSEIFKKRTAGRY